MDDAAPHAAAPRQDARACGGCLVGLLLLAAGLYGLGLALGQRLGPALPQAADGLALVEAAREVVRAAELPAAEREAALRAVLARLEATRAERRGPAEEELVRRVRALLGEGGDAPAGELGALGEALEAADAGDAARRLRELLAGESPSRNPELPLPPELAGELIEEPVPPTVGQWVVMRATRAGAPADVTYTFRWIAAVSEDEVTVRVQDLDPAPPRLARGPAYELFLSRRAAVPRAPGEAAEHVEAADATWRCVRIEGEAANGTHAVTWLSAELPVWAGLPGFVRQVVRRADGQEYHYELFRWGTHGGADRAVR